MPPLSLDRSVIPLPDTNTVDSGVGEGKVKWHGGITVFPLWAYRL